jgi:hypothetical protein
MILIPLPWIEDLFSVNSSLIYGARNSYIYKLTIHEAIKTGVPLANMKTSTKSNQNKITKWVWHIYQRRTPSFTRSNKAFLDGSMGRYFFKNGSSAR